MASIAAAHTTSTGEIFPTTPLADGMTYFMQISCPV
jgi:hypothetical protein